MITMKKETDREKKNENQVSIQKSNWMKTFL